MLDINIKMRGAADEYFEQLGVSQRVRALSHGYYTWFCACKGIRARWRRRRCVYSFRYCRHPKVRAPPLRVPMANFTPATIVRAFGGCARHRALAFRSLFAALDAKPRDYPAPGMGWLNRRAMVALLRPAPPLAAVVSRLAEELNKEELNAVVSRGVLPLKAVRGEAAVRGLGRGL